MSAPGGGGGSWQSGEDYVAARVSIDVDPQGIQTLKEMSSAVNNFRTVVEASARSSANFVQYLQQMQQAGQMVTQVHQQMAQQMQVNADLMQRTMGISQPGMPIGQQQLPMSRLAPQGFTDPFSGMGAGMGGNRGPSPGDVPSQLQQQAVDPARQLDPYKYVNAQAGRYRTVDMPTTPSGAPDVRAGADRIDAREKQTREQEDKTPASSDAGQGHGEIGHSDWIGSRGIRSMAGRGGLADNIMNEMSVGKGSPMGTLGMAYGGLKGLSAMRGRPSAAAGGGNAGTMAAQEASEGGSADGLGSVMNGGMLGGLLGKLGKGGGALGLGLGGLGLIQKGGAMYQGYKNLGAIEGGGAGEGFGLEMQTRMLALDPFISTEQARQVIMAGLTEGYKGKQFDTFKDFIVHNFKDMNVGVADQVQLLRNSILGGSTPEQGEAQVNSMLGIVKQLAKKGITDTPDLVKQVKDVQGALTSAGVPSGMALQGATEAANVWNTPETRGLKGEFGQYVASGNSLQGGMGLEVVGGVRAPGVPPQYLQAYMAANGGDPVAATGDALKKLVMRCYSNPRTHDKRSPAYWQSLQMFQRLAEVYFPGTKAGTDTNEAIQIVDSVIGGHDYIGEGIEGGKGSDGGPNAAQPAHHNFNFLSAVGKSIPALLTDNHTALHNAWDRGDGPTQGPMVNAMPQQYGGHPKAQGDQWSRQGEQGNRGPLASQAGTGGGNVNHNVAFQPAEVKITFGPNGPQATPNPARLSPNQQATNAGVGSASMNNPPPGDNYRQSQGFPSGV